jgi:hypothetical protein
MYLCIFHPTEKAWVTSKESTVLCFFIFILSKLLARGSISYFLISLFLVPDTGAAAQGFFFFNFHPFVCMYILLFSDFPFPQQYLTSSLIRNRLRRLREYFICTYTYVRYIPYVFHAISIIAEKLISGPVPQLLLLSFDLFSIIRT